MPVANGGRTRSNVDEAEGLIPVRVETPVLCLLDTDLRITSVRMVKMLFSFLGDMFPRSLPVVTDSSLSFSAETDFVPAENFCKG